MCPISLDIEHRIDEILDCGMALVKGRGFLMFRDMMVLVELEFVDWHIGGLLCWIN